MVPKNFPLSLCSLANDIIFMALLHVSCQFRLVCPPKSQRNSLTQSWTEIHRTIKQNKSFLFISYLYPALCYSDAKLPLSAPYPWLIKCINLTSPHWHPTCLNSMRIGHRSQIWGSDLRSSAELSQFQQDRRRYWATNKSAFQTHMAQIVYFWVGKSSTQYAKVVIGTLNFQL